MNILVLGNCNPQIDDETDDINVFQVPDGQICQHCFEDLISQYPPEKLFLAKNFKFKISDLSAEYIIRVLYKDQLRRCKIHFED